MKRTIALVAAFDSTGRILLLHRPNDVHCGDLWSLPGGKVEAGEEAMAAAVRELAEETGLTGSAWHTLGSHQHDYPDCRLEFRLFGCRCENLQELDCESPHAWAEIAELAHYPMPEANGPIIAILESMAD